MRTMNLRNFNQTTNIHAMDQKIYIVTATWCEEGEDSNSQIIGTFTSRKATRKCLASAKATNRREWAERYEDTERYGIEDTPDRYDAVELSGYGEFYNVTIEERTLQDSYTGWQELTEQMDEKQLKAFNDFINEYSAVDILGNAARDMEKPFGFVICYLRDQGLPKTYGYYVAEAILDYYHIDNENCPWLNNN